jgi:hypothetical protein
VFLVGSGGKVEGGDTSTGVADQLDAFLVRPGDQAARELLVTQGEILWATAEWAGPGALLLWADQSRGGGVELWFRALSGTELGPPERLGRGVSAWQVRSIDDKVLLAIASSDESGFGLEWLELDGTGHVSSRTVVSRELPPIKRLDFVQAASGFALAFEAETSLGPRLFGAVYTPGVGAFVPERLTRERGDQHLHELLSSPDGKKCWVTWSDSTAGSATEPRLQVGLFGDQPFLEPQWDLGTAPGDATLPLLAMREDGLIGVRRRKEGAPLEWFLLRDSSPPLVAAFRLPGLVDTPGLAWDLSCDPKKGCRALGASSVDDLAVFWTHDKALDFERESAAESRSPRLVSDEPLVRLPSIAAWSLNRAENEASAVWLATLTDFDPELLSQPGRVVRDTRKAPEQAHLTLHHLRLREANEAKHIGIGQNLAISVRARSMGGVALSTLNSSGGILAWAALDAGSPHIFLTSLDSSGRKVKQLMLPHKGGEISDVSVVQTGTDYVVAWVSTDDTGASIWTLRTDGKLSSAPVPRRVPGGAYAPSHLRLRNEDGEARLYYFAELEAYSDLAPDRKRGLFSVSLGPGASAPSSEPVLLHQTNHNLYSLEVFGEPGSPRFGWLESADASGASGEASFYLARPDKEGRGTLLVREVLSGVTAFTASSEADVSKILVLRPKGDKDALLGTTGTLAELSSLDFRPIALLPRPVSLAVSPTLFRDTLYYATGRGAEGIELRGMTLDFSTLGPFRSP